MKIKSLCVAIGMAALFCQPVQAKGILLINTGNELFEVAAFPAQQIGEFRDLDSMKAGYKCKRFGIFWADIWTWDCTLVGIAPDGSYLNLPAKIVSELSGDRQFAFSHAKRGFWNHYGFLACLGTLAGWSFLRRFI